MSRAVAFLVGKFPAPPQTFVLRELKTLLDLGVDLRVFALTRCPGDHLDAEHRPCVERTTYLPGLLSAALWKSHLHYLRRDPARYLRAMLTMLTLPGQAWWMVVWAPYVWARVPFVALQIERWAPGAHVHAHFATSPTEVALALSLLLGTTYSFTGHARDIYAVASALPEKIRRARFVIANNPRNARYLAGLCPEGRVELVRNWLPMPAAEPTHPRPTPPLILSAARFVEKKGLDTLVRSLGILRRQGVVFRALIVGEGPLRGALQRLVQEEQLAGLVELPGWKPYRELPPLYRRAAVFALPCRVARDGDRDGLPTVLLEALAHECPAVCTPVTGVPDLIQDGVHGLLVPSDDPDRMAGAIRRLLEDAELSRRLGQAGRARVAREFDERENSRRLAELLLAD